MCALLNMSPENQIIITIIYYIKSILYCKISENEVMLLLGTHFFFHLIHKKSLREIQKGRMEKKEESETY